MKIFFHVKKMVFLAIALIAICSQAAKVSIDYDPSDLGGPRIYGTGHGFAAETFMVIADAHGKATPLARNVVETTGGVIFVEVAIPVGEDVQTCPALSYQHDSPYGKRIHAKYGEIDAYRVMADWEIKPAVAVVNSGAHSLWSEVGVVTNPFPARKTIAHPALVDTFVGFLTFLADNPGVYPEDKIAYTFRNQSIRGFNKTFNGDPIPPAKFDPTYSGKFDVFSLAPAGTTQLMFTDWGSTYSYRLAKESSPPYISMTGNPYILFVNKNSGDRIEATVFDKSLENYENPIYTANSMMYGAMTRFSRNLAYFRSLKMRCSAQWTQFSNSVRVNSDIEDLAIETPRAIDMH